jgi:hypothetical protein
MDTYCLEVQVVIVDAIQYENVVDVDASSILVSRSSKFAGRLVVELVDGNVLEYGGEHGRFDYLSKYGFVLMSFTEKVNNETRSFETLYQDLKSEIDANTLQHLSILRGI